MDDEYIIAEATGGVGRIIINRPSALNALSEAMCRDILKHLLAWRDDAKIEFVLITGSAGRAFCAGGDVRSVAPRMRGNMKAAEAYFTTEYSIDALINAYPKPVVVLADGLTMGAGAGILLNATHSIMTEKMDFAMPETAIGLFPDVGASVFLRRMEKFNLSGAIGVFLGLTGWRLGAGDLLALGIIDRMVTSQSVDIMIKAMLQDGIEVIDQFLVPADDKISPEHPIYDARDWIDQHFGLASLLDIRASLEGDKHPMAAQILQILATRTPLSLAVTHRLLTPHRAMPTSIAAALAQDYALACRMGVRDDFAEGVRALLIDKDNTPCWNPSRLEDVDTSMVEAIFSVENMPIFKPITTNKEF